jgi:tRNA G26 N,N-dimethylase Trm1
LFYELGELARRCGTSAPPRQRIFDELARRGYSASPAHCRAKALKTDAPYAELLDATRTAAADVAAMHAAAASAQSGDDG